MNLKQFDKLDPNLLPGLLNTALRNDCDNLEDLARTHDLDQEALEQKLKHLGYRYVAGVNQFRPVPGSGDS
ncbi:MAG: DUF4250 domain-containing protein [Verrucomicrobiales bacterium]|nr:DUF4250 domain-containing protein [Verrucomicrobiales bacterium]